MRPMSAPDGRARVHDGCVARQGESRCINVDDADPIGPGPQVSPRNAISRFGNALFRACRCFHSLCAVT